MAPHPGPTTIAVSVRPDRVANTLTLVWPADADVLGRPVEDVVGYQLTGRIGGGSWPVPHTGVDPSATIAWDEAAVYVEVEVELTVTARFTDGTTSAPMVGAWTLPSYHPPPPSGVRWSAGPTEVVVDNTTRLEAGLWAWMDGTMDVATVGETRWGFAPNSGNVARWVVDDDGLLDARAPIDASIVISGPTHDYAAGGPLLADEPHDQLLMLYHGERHGPSDAFWSYIGLARSVDEGATWTSLGPIIEPELPWATLGPSMGVEVGGGPYVLVGDDVHVYFRDHLASGRAHNLSVARAPLSTVLTAAAQGTAAPFEKWDGGWRGQPGLGGSSTDLLPDVRAPRWWDVIHLEDHDLFVLAGSDQGFAGQWSTIVRTSVDGLAWQDVECAVAPEPTGEILYLSLSAPPGCGSARRARGDAIHLYRTRSSNPADRWADTAIERITLTYSGGG